MEMETPEQPVDKVTNCNCYNIKSRPCKYEVLYDEALCQVESLQRQVRHLRTEMRRVEGEHAVLVQQMNKYNNEPQPDVTQLKAKHEIELKKREESWQRELKRWKKEFQNRDVEIVTLKARIAELECEHSKSSPFETVQPEVRHLSDVASLSVGGTLPKKNSSTSSVKVVDKCSDQVVKAGDKSYDEIMDELFGSSPEPDLTRNMDDRNSVELLDKNEDFKPAKVKVQDKKLSGKSSTRDETQAASHVGEKKEIDIRSSEIPKKTKQSIVKSAGAVVNKESFKSSSPKQSLPPVENHKGVSETKPKNCGRNVFEKMKIDSGEFRKDTEQGVEMVSSSDLEKQTTDGSGPNENKIGCKERRKASTSGKDVMKFLSLGHKIKKPISPKKIAVPVPSRVESELQTKKSEENFKVHNSVVDSENEKMLDVVASSDVKQQNNQKRDKSKNTEKLASFKLQNVEKIERKSNKTLLSDSMPCSETNEKSGVIKKDLTLGAIRKDKKSAEITSTKSTGIGKSEKAKTIKASNMCRVPNETSKAKTKTVNMSDYERVKAYMDLANRIECEKKQPNRPKKVKSSDTVSHQNCISPPLSSSDFDDHHDTNEAPECHPTPTGSCYSPSVIPVKEDEYDPFNPGIDVFPMSKYNIKKDSQRTAKKWPLLHQNVLKISSVSDLEMRKPSDLHEEYSPSRIWKNDSDCAEGKQIEPVLYIPSVTTHPHVKDSSRFSPLSLLSSETKPNYPDQPSVKVDPPVHTSPGPSVLTNLPGQDHSIPVNEPRSLSRSLQKNRFPPTTKASLLDVSQSSTHQPKHCDSGKPPTDTNSKRCVTAPASGALPQLNLSSIGDNLLSGVREALNMVKTLSPQVSSNINDQPCVTTPNCPEKEPPLSQVTVKKKSPVLMPSPLKKRPKDKDRHVLHAKILSSIELNDKSFRDGSDSKGQNDKTTPSGRLWRKRKRTATAEPKSILKKTRSVPDEDVPDAVQTLTSSTSETGLQQKISHSSLDANKDDTRLCNTDVVHNGQHSRDSFPVSASSEQVIIFDSAVAEHREGTLDGTGLSRNVGNSKNFHQCSTECKEKNPSIRDNNIADLCSDLCSSERPEAMDISLSAVSIETGDQRNKQLKYNATLKPEYGKMSRVDACTLKNNATAAAEGIDNTMVVEVSSVELNTGDGSSKLALTKTNDPKLDDVFNECSPKDASAILALNNGSRKSCGLDGRQQVFVGPTDFQRPDEEGMPAITDVCGSLREHTTARIDLSDDSRAASVNNDPGIPKRVLTSDFDVDHIGQSYSERYDAPNVERIRNDECTSSRESVRYSEDHKHDRNTYHDSGANIPKKQHIQEGPMTSAEPLPESRGTSAKPERENSDCSRVVGLTRKECTELMDTSDASLELSGYSWGNEVSLSSSATSGSSCPVADETGSLEVRMVPQGSDDKMEANDDADGRETACEIEDGKADQQQPAMDGAGIAGPEAQSDNMLNNKDYCISRDHQLSVSDDLNCERGSPVVDGGDGNWHRAPSAHQNPISSSSRTLECQELDTSEMTSLNTSQDHLMVSSLALGEPQIISGSLVEPSSMEANKVTELGDNDCGDGGTFTSVTELGDNDCGDGGTFTSEGRVNIVDSSSMMDNMTIKREVCSSPDNDDIRDVPVTTTMSGCSSPHSVIVLSDDESSYHTDSDTSSSSSSSSSSSASSCGSSSGDESGSGSPVSVGDRTGQTSNSDDDDSGSESRSSNLDDSSSDGSSRSGSDSATSRSWDSSAASSCGANGSDSEQRELEEGDDVDANKDVEPPTGGGTSGQRSSSDFEIQRNGDSDSGSYGDEHSSNVDDDVKHGKVDDPEQAMPTNADESVTATADPDDNGGPSREAVLETSDSGERDNSMDDGTEPSSRSHDEDVIDIFIDPDSYFDLGSVPDGEHLRQYSRLNTKVRTLKLAMKSSRRVRSRPVFGRKGVPSNA
ncbi:hypothetical protein LSH36_600g01041 [Paralvinella palmiformis]|uniref:Uncharacterized protein n=1 Tax=Paralvinella palmiformis TaxID=53620 RepID=A0AAD9MUS3_9ANNE|nr:hypothetical protein LSH36_600g01041 [Paralvinella palmiformis]